MKVLKKIFTSAIFFCILLTGCASSQKNIAAPLDIAQTLPLSQLCPLQIEWEEIEPGISYFSYNVRPVKVKWHAVRIDLQTPGLKIITNTDTSRLQKKQICTFNETAKACSVLFNTTPFIKKNGSYDLMGIAINNGTEYSSEEKRLYALYLKQESDSTIKAEIISQDSLKKDSLYEEGTWVTGGYFNLIKQGEIQKFNDIPHSNTVCGISQDKRYLYVLAAIPTLSLSDENGLYYGECALILQKLGCYNAISFDGGTSTQMYVKGKGTFAPALKRKVPACLGFSKINP